MKKLMPIDSCYLCTSRQWKKPADLAPHYNYKANVLICKKTGQELGHITYSFPDWCPLANESILEKIKKLIFAAKSVLNMFPKNMAGDGTFKMGWSNKSIKNIKRLRESLEEINLESRTNNK